MLHLPHITYLCKCWSIETVDTSTHGWWNSSISQLITRKLICHKFFVSIVSVFLPTRTKLSLVHTLTIVCKISHYFLDEFPISVLVCNLSSPAFLVPSDLHKNNNSQKIIQVRCLQWQSKDSRMVGERMRINIFRCSAENSFDKQKNLSGYSVLTFCSFSQYLLLNLLNRFTQIPWPVPTWIGAGLHHGYANGCLTCNLFCLLLYIKIMSI